MQARRQEAAAASAVGAQPGYPAAAGAGPQYPGYPGGTYQYGGQQAAPQPAQGTGYRYLKAYTFSEIIGDIFDIYLNNFLTLFLLSLMPMAVVFVFVIFAVLLGVAAGLSLEHAGAGAAGLIGFLALIFIPVMMYVQFYFTSAMIVAISHVFYGYRPQVMDSLRRVDYWVPAKLLATILLQMVIMAAVFVPVMLLFVISRSPAVIVIGILFLIPAAFYLMTLFFFTMPVVVIEDIWLVDAIKRSMELGKGYYLRNLVILLAISVALAIILMVVSIPLSFIPFLGQLTSMAIQVVVTPITMILIMILYFDMRVRKEPRSFAG